MVTKLVNAANLITFKQDDYNVAKTTHVFAIILPAFAYFLATFTRYY